MILYPDWHLCNFISLLTLMQQSLLALFFSQLWYEKNRAPPHEYRMGKNYWHAKNLIWNIRLAKVWKSFADIFSICIVFIFYILDAAFFVPLYFSFFPFSFADGEESNFTWNFIKLGIITVPVCCAGPSLEGGKGNNRLLLFLIYLIISIKTDRNLEAPKEPLGA